MKVAAAGSAGAQIDHADYDVVVVGGGPVGLAAAIDLGGRGVAVLLVDAGDGAIEYPTAESIDVRTMEWLRQNGISAAVDTSGFPADYPRDIAFVTRLATHELARFRRPSNRNRAATTRGISPEGAVWWPKFWFDTALRDRAFSLPTVTVRYGWRCTRTEVDGDRVTVTVERPGGDSREVSAKYVVACDGARSDVRRALGITMAGQPGEAVWQGVFADIPDLHQTISSDPAVQYYTLRPRRAIFGSLNGANLWRVTYPLTPGEMHGPEEVADTLRACIGTDDITVTVIDSRTWSGRTAVASAYRVGRILIAGDAAHQMWPSGGHGMNTGIGDVHNLCWKLALVLDGRAGEALLDTYELERRPVAERNTLRAQSNYLADAALPTGPDLDRDDDSGAEARARAADAVIRTRAREWSSLGIQLGYRYSDSPVVFPADDSPVVFPADHPDTSDDAEDYVPSGVPGNRAPHVELPDGSSTLDLFGRSFVLLVHSYDDDKDGWVTALAERGVPLEVATVSGADATSCYPSPLTLVRPDGFIAWAGSRSDEAATLADALLCGSVVG